MELSSKYSPQSTEEKWYEHWMKKNYFHSTPDEREPYTIVTIKMPIKITNVRLVCHKLAIDNNDIKLNF